MDYRMIFGSIILIFVSKDALAKMNETDLCEFYDTVKVGKPLHVKSPHWPNRYDVGVICRWIFDCPGGYVCRLRCHDIGLPLSSECHVDKLLVSRSGNPHFLDADIYCGRTTINTRSTSTRISMELQTQKGSPGGRFRCSIKAETAV